MPSPLIQSSSHRSRPLLGLLSLALVAGMAALPARAQDSEVITSIEVKGAKKISAETLQFKAGVKVGDDLRTLDLTEILERLWASGAYDDIKFEVEDEKSGKKFIIRVVERPIVKEVDYRGGTELGISNLKDKIKEKKLEIKTDTPYDPETARKVKDLVVEQAAEKGYRNPVIDVQLEPTGPGVARLVFDIKEGGKVRIYDVAFKGNKVLPASRLASVMEKTRRHWMFSWLTSHDLLVEKNMTEDVDKLKEEYWRLGYKDVFVGKPIVTVEDHTTERRKKKNEEAIKNGKSPKYDLRAKVVVPILEGEKFYEGKLSIEGNEKIFRGKGGIAFMKNRIAEAKRDNRSWMAKFLNIKPSIEDLPANVNQPFDLDALKKGLGKIAEDYRNAAYINGSPDPTYTVREENGVKKVDVAVKITEGEMYTIRKLNFEGNSTTKDKVLRRSMWLNEGSPFQMEALKESFTGLGQLGFFDVKGNEPKIEFVRDQPQVDVTIRGEESGVNELLFQGGYSSVFSFSLGMQFSTRNLGGGGETLSFAFNSGKFQRNVSVSFTEPYVFDRPYGFSASVSNGSVDYDASRVGEMYAYKQFSRSLGVSTSTKLSTFIPESLWAFRTSLSLGYSFRIIRIEGGRNQFFKDDGSQLTSTVNTGIQYNTVDHPFKPSTGTRMGMNFEYGGWQFGGDKPFYRVSFDAAKFTNWADRHIFGVNASYGYLGNLGTESLPIFDLYRPGGENSIRGYRWGNVGSMIYDDSGQPVVIGGNKQFIFNAEYQFKIADQFRTVIFYDMGNAWAQGTKSFSEPLRRSTGVELRFFLPISPAPMRLIWSRKLNPYPYDRDGKNDFQFSIGTTF